ASRRRRTLAAGSHPGSPSRTPAGSPGRHRSATTLPALLSPCFVRGAEERLAVAIHAEATDQLLAFGAGEEIGKGARFIDPRGRVALRRDDEERVRVAEIRAAGVEDFEPDLL